MKKSVFVLKLLIFVAGFLTACERADEGTTTTETRRMTDSDLENTIKAKLNSNAQLRDANLDVDANVDRNEVTLSGKVGSQELRSKAVELARSAQTGITVNDKIDVIPQETTRESYTEEQAREERTKARERGETVGATLDDAWIHSKLVAKFIADPDTPQRKINIDVSNNVVTLRGTVETPEAKAEAERIAKETEGVKRVVNQLKVGGANK
jgi:hyperosmotically inducible protein